MLAHSACPKMMVSGYQEFKSSKLSEIRSDAIGLGLGLIIAIAGFLIMILGIVLAVFTGFVPLPLTVSLSVLGLALLLCGLVLSLRFYHRRSNHLKQLNVMASLNSLERNVFLLDTACDKMAQTLQDLFNRSETFRETSEEIFFDRFRTLRSSSKNMLDSISVYLKDKCLPLPETLEDLKEKSKKLTEFGYSFLDSLQNVVQAAEDECELRDMCRLRRIPSEDEEIIIAPIVALYNESLQSLKILFEKERSTWTYQEILDYNAADSELDENLNKRREEIVNNLKCFDCLLDEGPNSFRNRVRDIPNQIKVTLEDKEKIVRNRMVVGKMKYCSERFTGIREIFETEPLIKQQELLLQKEQILRPDFPRNFAEEVLVVESLKDSFNDMEWFLKNSVEFERMRVSRRRVSKDIGIMDRIIKEFDNCLLRDVDEGSTIENNLILMISRLDREMTHKNKELEKFTTHFCMFVSNLVDIIDLPQDQQRWELSKKLSDVGNNIAKDCNIRWSDNIVSSISEESLLFKMDQFKQRILLLQETAESISQSKVYFKDLLAHVQLGANESVGVLPSHLMSMREGKFLELEKLKEKCEEIDNVIMDMELRFVDLVPKRGVLKSELVALDNVISLLDKKIVLSDLILTQKSSGTSTDLKEAELDILSNQIKSAKKCTIEGGSWFEYMTADDVLLLKRWSKQALEYLDWAFKTEKRITGISHIIMSSHCFDKWWESGLPKSVFKRYDQNQSNINNQKDELNKTLNEARSILHDAKRLAYPALTRRISDQVADLENASLQIENLEKNISELAPLS